MLLNADRYLTNPQLYDTMRVEKSDKKMETQGHDDSTGRQIK